MVEIIRIQNAEVQKLLSQEEGHFLDLKSLNIAPAKLTRTIAALSNAEGGELFIGIEDSPRKWSGFANVEAANGHIQAFESLFPLGDGYEYRFLQNENETGLVLKVDIQKSRGIKKASDDKIYIRRGAQNLPLTTPQDIDRLNKNKGISSYETETANVEKEIITNSTHTIGFMLEIVPSAEPEAWLKKQRVIINEHPTVAGIILFAEEPQAILPKHCGCKIYQYRTKEEGTRDSLMFNPITIEGNAYSTIFAAVDRTKKIIESIRIRTDEGLKSLEYPTEALHEIITNAVLHRDYSIADDIHIRIYDNRVEIQSPGTLPAHITPENILAERFARNGTIVRLVNKFPDAPNKDVGEGLNTAFEAMQKMRLKQPSIEQIGGNVIVTLRHESLATPQELIINYLKNHDSITNKDAREICSIQSENTVKHIFKRMVDDGLIEPIKGVTVFKTAYRLKTKD